MSSGEEKVIISMIGDFAGGMPVRVHVKDGKVIRIRPMIYSDDEAKPWSLKVGNKVYTPQSRTNPAPWDMSFRRRLYNPKRVKYPVMRKGYKPGGKSDTSNRGQGEFVRISWDEALGMATDELKRIKRESGNSAILSIGSGHGAGGMMNSHGVMRRVFDFWGGFTRMIRNPDSWEGWYWGTEHVWGFAAGNGIPNLLDLLEDTLQNSELSVFWSYDLEQSGLIGGQDKAEWLLWLKSLGRKMIFITPDLNFTAGVKADKWIPIRPGTDAALAAAIANVWINEGTYEREYVYSHAVGFDRWKEYILGQEDGIPKTPEWAESITGVGAPVTRALAREWAKKRTHLAIRYGAACRTPYATEWARMMAYLQVMQGLGKPGVNIHPLSSVAPFDTRLKAPPRGIGEFCPFNSVAKKTMEPQCKQMIHQPLIPDAILNPPVSWYGGQIGQATEQQFVKYTYPLPGHSEARLIWEDTVSNLANWNNTYKWAEAFRSPKIETFVAQSIFMENDALFADILLPVNTVLERDDISYPGLFSFLDPGKMPSPVGRGSDVNIWGIFYMKKAIEPLGDSRSDYDIALDVARRLGVEKEFTEGNSLDDWIKKVFEATSAANYISFEDFKKKGYYVFKFPDDWKRNPGFRGFYETGGGLGTPSGKFEFYSERLAQKFPDDKERPPVAKYIAEGETHQESLTSKRAQKYPLLVDSPHPRYRFHSEHETISWLWEIPTAKVKKDGKFYEPVWMNPKDASERNIKDGDLVRIFNERGSVVYAAYITERMMPGVVKAPDGSGYAPVKKGKYYAGLPINMITPHNMTSKNAHGMAVNGFLVQIEKLEEK